MRALANEASLHPTGQAQAFQIRDLRMVSPISAGLQAGSLDVQVAVSGADEIDYATRKFAFKRNWRYQRQGPRARDHDAADGSC